MNPKEKAITIYDKHYEAIPTIDDEGRLEHECAIQSALITVDEIIGAIDWHEFETPNNELDYWYEVKQEIEKL